MFASPGAIALQLGPLAIRWYGLLIATGVLLGSTLAHREAIRRGQNPDILLNGIVLTVLTALIGARLYYVLFNWDYYSAHPSKIVAVWEGGLAIHGGLIVGAVTTALYCRHARLSLPMTTDILSPCVAIGQAEQGSELPERPLSELSSKPRAAGSTPARRAFRPREGMT